MEVTVFSLNSVRDITYGTEVVVRHSRIVD